MAEGLAFAVCPRPEMTQYYTQVCIFQKSVEQRMHIGAYSDGLSTDVEVSGRQSSVDGKLLSQDYSFMLVAIV